MVKTLENVHTHWNPRQLGRRLRLGPGRGTEALRRPLEHIRKLMCSSHILARIHMKLGTHIDLIELEQLLRYMSWAPLQQEFSNSGLFKKAHALELEILPPRIFNTSSTKLGERDLKTLGILNCGGIFDISNGLPVARRWSYGENWDTGSV